MDILSQKFQINISRDSEVQNDLRNRALRSDLMDNFFLHNNGLSGHREAILNVHELKIQNSKVNNDVSHVLTLTVEVGNVIKTIIVKPFHYQPP